MPVIGIDVSKSKLHCVLLSEEGKRKAKAFSNAPDGYASLVQWALYYGHCEITQLHAVLEATGVYHEAVALSLRDAQLKVSVLNPAQVKHFAKGLAVKTKTDASDPVVLARYGELLKPPPWQPPAPEVSALRAFIHRLEAIEADIRREHNRLEKSTLTHSPTIVRESLEKSLRFLEEEKTRLEATIREHIEQHPSHIEGGTQTCVARFREACSLKYAGARLMFDWHQAHIGGGLSGASKVSGMEEHEHAPSGF